jgi:hypothetical protein
MGFSLRIPLALANNILAQLKKYKGKKQKRIEKNKKQKEIE